CAALNQKASVRPVTGAGRYRQYHRRQLLVVVEQVHGVGKNLGGLPQQRIGTVFRSLLAGRVLDDVTLVGGQAVIGGNQRQRVQRQPQLLAGLLAFLPARLVGIALAAPRDLVQRDRGLGRLLTETGHIF